MKLMGSYCPNAVARASDNNDFTVHR
jgi:hypothetical protein